MYQTHTIYLVSRSISFANVKKASSTDVGRDLERDVCDEIEGEGGIVSRGRDIQVLGK